MYPKNTLSVLSSQGSRRGHSITAMRRNDLLIGFEAPARLPVSAMCLAVSKRKSLATTKRGQTHAPPELSEPAITRMRFIVASVSWYSEFDGDFESSRCPTIELLGPGLRPRLTSSNACFRWVCATTCTVWSIMHRCLLIEANMYCVSCINVYSWFRLASSKAPFYLQISLAPV